MVGDGNVCIHGHLLSETLRTRKSGVQYCCECQNRGNKKWGEKNKDKIRSYERKSYQKRRDDKLKQCREWYWANKDKKRVQALTNKYGITGDDFNDIFNRQGRKCAICGSTNTDQWRMNVDHDHKTGKVRGILCNTCNTSLGGFKEDGKISVKLLRKACIFCMGGSYDLVFICPTETCPLYEYRMGKNEAHKNRPRPVFAN